MEGNEDPFSVLRLLESPHGFESCIEVTDVRFESVRGGRNPRIDEVCEGMAAGFLEAQEDVAVDGTQAEDVCFNESLQVFPTQGECFCGGIE